MKYKDVEDGIHYIRQLYEFNMQIAKIFSQFIESIPWAMWSLEYVQLYSQNATTYILNISH